MFSAKSIADAPPQLRQAMEQVAGRAESLAKSKTQEAPPPPFRKRSTKSVQQLDWDPKRYKDDGKESRDERNKKRTVRVFGIEQLGLDEYQKLMREIDSMTGSAELDRIVKKRVQEVKERLEDEQLAREADERRQTRSQTETPGTSKETERVPPAVRSPRKCKREEENQRKDIGGKKPKTPDRKETGGKKPKTPEHKTTGGKTPKASERKETAGKTPKTTEHTTTGGKKPKTPATKGPQHVDDNEFELDVATGKFLRKKAPVTEQHDESTSRKGKPADKTSKPSDTGDESKSRGRKQKKTTAVPLLEDDDNDDDDDLMLVDDEDRDKDYEPENDEENDEDYPVVGDDNDGDEDDFQVPKLRSRKVLSARKGKSKTSRDQQDDLEDFETTEKTSGGVEVPDDDTFNLFREIVGEKFASLTMEEFDKFRQDKSINPVEAAGFRVTMKELASRLKEAVRKGQKIEEKYREMIEQTIKIARAMEYPGVNNVKVKDVLESIPDRSCNAWRLHMRGRTQMDMTDFVLDDEEHEADRDLVIQGPMLNEDDVTKAAQHLKSLPTLLKNDAVKLLADLYENQARAHEYAAASCRKLKELHKILPFETFLRVADGAVRPLVIMHIPKTEEIVLKLRTAAEKSSRKTTGASTVIEVMEKRNLPQLKKDWTMTDVDKPKKMIACIVFKYVRDAMFPTDTTPTHQVVKEFNVVQTTVHCHMYGKKYPGGGQVLKQMKKRDTKLLQGIRRRVGESTSGTEKVEEVKVTSTSKGKGGGKSSTTKRLAEEIRGDSTAAGEKVKRKRKKEEDAAEEAELNEDPDMPTKKEIAASKPATKPLRIIH